jgi:hypothetical protein
MVCKLNRSAAGSEFEARFGNFFFYRVDFLLFFGNIPPPRRNIFSSF